MIVVAVAVVLVFGPLLLGLRGLFQARRGGYTSPEPAAPWNWKQTISSALLYPRAFNLTFFVQELFLVLPKALTPGVRPTLFHNNHSWQGENPLTSLFQAPGRSRSSSAVLFVRSSCSAAHPAPPRFGCSSSGWRTTGSSRLFRRSSSEPSVLRTTSGWQ